jgi:uncharacterized membrane protein
MRQHARAAVTEELVLTEDSLQVTRRGPRGGLRDWRANPHWTRVELHETGGPVESYLTLAGGGRTIELGAFLSPEERVALGRELRLALAGLPGYPFAG